MHDEYVWNMVRRTMHVNVSDCCIVCIWLDWCLSVTECRIVSRCDGVCVGGYMVRNLELNHMRDTKLNRRTIISESLL